MNNWQPSAELHVIRQRALILKKIRAFFDVRECLEVETPAISPAANSDVNIESIEVVMAGSTHFLQTSPEFAMKRLLAAGSGSIYQICHAFRAGEKGRLHNPEFTLIEWYRIGFDYQQLMAEIEALINLLSPKQCHFERLSYRQLFQRYLDFDILQISHAKLKAFCDQAVSGTDVATLDFDQCLDLLLSLIIAPQMKGYQFIFDYPISQASLARAKPDDGQLAERFELFCDGLELANGFSELTDASLQRQRFEQDNDYRRKNGLKTYAIDEKLLAALEAGLPECAGVALGLDRLLMVLLGLESIEQTIAIIQ